MTRKTNTNTITRVIPKRDTQSMIKALRQAGLEVEKDTGGMYSCDMKQEEVDSDGNKTGNSRLIRLFTAMPGSRGYLVRMQKDLFTN